MGNTRIRPTAQAMAEMASEDQSRYYYPEDPKNLLVADPSRRVPVRFESDGLTLAGHLYRPPNVPEGRRTPAVVMCGPSSSVKEQTLPHYAERLSDAGYAVLTFDSRTFGESEGEPRCHYDPNQIIEDYANAVSYVLTREDVDEGRVGVVGVCMGGGYAVSTAARDKRVRAAASVGGGFDIGGTFVRNIGPEGFRDWMAQLNALRQRQYETGEVQYVPAIARDLSEGLAFMPNEEAYSYYDRTSKDHAPTWENRVTVASLEPYFTYNAVAHAPLVAPAPLLIVHNTTDFFLLPEYAQAAYDAAVGPKELVWIETHNHIEIYDQDPYVSQAVAAVVAFLDANLVPAAPAPASS